MVSLPVFDLEGKSKGSIDLDKNIFDIPVKKSVVHEVLVTELAAKRQGTASTKTRGEVRGGGKKPWRQKGTGRARAGSIRSPLWKGGGVVFGPKPRDYSKKISKKLKQLALLMSIIGKIKSNSVKVIENISLHSQKTKQFAQILKNLGIDSGLLILDSCGVAEKRCAANIEKIKLVNSKNISVFDILKHRTLLLDKSAVSNLNERFQKNETKQ